MWVKAEDGKRYWMDSSNYFASARLGEYFGRPLSRPFGLPQHVKDKVEIEKLDHPNLPELDPLNPIRGSCSVNGRERECQIVLGYREIFLKRQRIEFLEELGREVEELGSEGIISELERIVAVGGGERRQGERGSQKTKNKKKNKKTTFNFSLNCCKGKKKSGGQGRKRTTLKNKGWKSKVCPWKKKRRTRVAPRANSKKANQTVPKKDQNLKVKDHQKAKEERSAKEEKVKAKELEQKGVTRKNVRTASDFSLVPPSKDKCEIEQEFHEPKPDFTVVEKIEAVRARAIKLGKPIVRQLSLGSHYMVLTHSGQQLDSEWLQLSASTDGEGETRKARLKRIKKPHEDWMDPGLNYSSQKMFRSLSLFLCLLTFTLRNPFSIQPCYRNKIPMVHVFRNRMLLFSFSTIFIWMVLGFMLINALDLKYRTEEDDIYKNMELEELMLYYIPVLGVFINVFLAAFWSILLLLHYSLVLANYVNLWAKAMPLLEMNPSPSLSRYIRNHSICYIVYALLVTLSFAYDWPAVTRGTFGQVFVLITRQMWPRVRLIKGNHFFWGQLGCCGIYLYCVWVNRTIFMFMHIFSIILRNASYQWNLNFSIRFQLIVTYYRAHLLRIATQGSLIRLYTQHRLIVGLCNYYGKVFLHPLCIYMVTNMGVVTLIMIYFIRYEEKDPKEFNYDYKLDLSHLGNSVDAVIYHTLKKQDEVTAVTFVLIQCLVDFIIGTLGIGWGSQAIQESFEFVRRHGLIQCNSRHERRLIHSLYMSFGSPNSPMITADSYFGMTKGKIFSGLMVMAFFWTMIIQCQVEQPSAMIEWLSNSSGKCADLPVYEDVRGGFYCMKSHKQRMKVKNRTRRQRLEEIRKKNINYKRNEAYWFTDECLEDTFLTAGAHIFPKEYGICKIVFPETNTEEIKDLKIRFPRHITEDIYKQFLNKWERLPEHWAPPTGPEFQTVSLFPCESQKPSFSWKTYYRDMFYRCPSGFYSTSVMFPVMFYRKEDYPSRDCLNPLVGKMREAGYCVFDVERRDGRDCGINAIWKKEVEQAKVVTCDGSRVLLDDCGSPNAPDFRFDEGGIFRKPTLRYFTEKIPLPDVYRDAGFEDKGSIRCWNTLTALVKCANMKWRKYCRLSKRSAVFNTTHYLYGKSCYDFKYFAVFEPPDEYLFCKHPYPGYPNNKDGKLWISTTDYDQYMSTFRPSTTTTTTTATTTTTTTTTTMTTSTTTSTTTTTAPTTNPTTIPDPPPPPRKRRSVSGLNATKLPGRSASLKNLTRRKKRETPGGPYPMPSVKSLMEAHYEVYASGAWENVTARHQLFSDFFPCMNSDRVVLAWLPLPVIKNGNGDSIPLKHIQELRKVDKTCWRRPYTLDTIKKAMKEHGMENLGIKAIKDLYGTGFLDDCLHPWFKYYVDQGSFIPDLVFQQTLGRLKKHGAKSGAGGYYCWDFVDPKDCAGIDCINLEHSSDLMPHS